MSAAAPPAQRRQLVPRAATAAPEPQPASSSRRRDRRRRRAAASCWSRQAPRDRCGRAVHDDRAHRRALAPPHRRHGAPARSSCLVEDWPLVQHFHSATRDCAHGELASAREAELPHDDDIERRGRACRRPHGQRRHRRVAGPARARPAGRRTPGPAVRRARGRPRLGRGTAARNHPASAGRTTSPMSSTIAVSACTRRRR